MMLNFLRRHQRLFLIIVTAAVVISFSFFGTYSTIAARVPDKELFKGVCGKPIMQQELFALCRLIESSPYSQSTFEKSSLPNFLNDGVIEKDFLSSGLATLLAKRYFEELRVDLDTRIKKIRHYRPYVHPQLRQVSVENVWMRFAPMMLDHFRKLQSRSDQATTETLALMTQLYLDQAMLPADTLKQVLAMQQNQQGIELDPLFINADLSLFGFKSLEDWFGPSFVPLIAQFILNASQLAEEKGYDVKPEEIRADLYQNIVQNYREASKNAALTPAETENYFQMKTQQLGVDESAVLAAWKKVMLFRRLFEDGSCSVLIDPLAYQQFDKFAKESVHVTLYQLPSALQLSDFLTMLKLQVYLEAVALEPTRLRTDLRLPQQFASLETIEKRMPELVERQFTLEWSGISKDDLAQMISVKETWDWEIENSHWELLRKNFSEVAALRAETKAERLAALDTLGKLRVTIDRFARFAMLDEHPEKIQAALESATVQTSTLGIRLRGGDLPFRGIKERLTFIKLLESAALKNENPNAPAQKLLFYSQDKENFFRIQVVAREAQKKSLTFATALHDGTLDKLLDQRLEEAYPEVRKKELSAFQYSNGQWKAFNEVKDLVGKILFADLLKAIEDQYRAHFGLLPGKAGELPLLFYSNARLLPFMKEAYHKLQANPEDPSWIMTSQEAGMLGQWRLEKADKVVQRCTQLPFAKEEMFRLAPQEWSSSVAMGERGALAFYFVKEREGYTKLPLESIQQGHQILAHDAKRDMMLQILQKIQSRKAINLRALMQEEQP